MEDKRMRQAIAPESVAQAYLDAFRARDIAGCVESFDDRGSIHFLSGVFQGRSAIEEWHRERFAAELEILGLNQAEARGDKVTIDLVVTSKKLRAWKLSRLAGRVTLLVSDGKIVEARLSPRMYNPLNPDLHRFAVGGLWDEVGRLQFDYLVRHGLRPEHYFLDVGCGSLRGGVHFIKYLEPGHYFGVDRSRELLDAGRDVELKRYHLEGRSPTLVQMDDFRFDSLGQEFHYALAHSVFTHLPLNSIVRCIVSMERVLVPNGSFYATFFENPKGKYNLDPIRRPQVDGIDVSSHFDKDPYHYDFQTFEWICEGTSLRAEYLGNWNQPRGQMMVVFKKDALQV